MVKNLVLGFDPISYSSWLHPTFLVHLETGDCGKLTYPQDRTKQHSLKPASHSFTAVMVDYKRAQTSSVPPLPRTSIKHKIHH